MNNGFTHNQARIPAARTTGFALATLLLVCGAFLLTSCGHEPEKATPPAQTETQNTNAASTGANEKATSTEEGNADKAADEKASQDDSAKAAKHQGAYAIAIRNGGGADGLAGAAQAKLVAAGLTEDNHTYALDSYAIAGGLAPTTVVYVKGTGDDAADVKEEAEKVVSALGLAACRLLTKPPRANRWTASIFSSSSAKTHWARCNKSNRSKEQAPRQYQKREALHKHASLFLYQRF